MYAAQTLESLWEDFVILKKGANTWNQCRRPFFITPGEFWEERSQLAFIHLFLSFTVALHPCVRSFIHSLFTQQMDMRCLAGVRGFPPPFSAVQLKQGFAFKRANFLMANTSFTATVGYLLSPHAAKVSARALKSLAILFRLLGQFVPLERRT